MATGRYSPIGRPKQPLMVCPYCEIEIQSFESEYSQAQAEVIVVVLCPHCRKVLGIVNHDCDD